MLHFWVSLHVEWSNKEPVLALLENVKLDSGETAVSQAVVKITIVILSNNLQKTNHDVQNCC